MATSQAVHEQQCPECGGAVSATDSEHVCRDCGAVLDDAPIDPGPEWRSFEGSGETPRATHGKRPNLPNIGLGSRIGDGDMNARRETINRHIRNGGKKDGNRAYATCEIQRMASALDVPDSIADQAKHLFRQIHEADRAHGNDLDVLSSTSLYTVCRANSKGLTPGDVADVARTDAECIARWHTRLCDEFGVTCPPPDPAQRLRVVGSDLDVPQRVVDRALDMLEDVGECERYRGSPSTLAATLLYRAAGGGLTQVEVCDAAGCTPVSLRNRESALEGGR